MTWVWEHSPTRGTDLLLLLAIADFAGESGIAWPSRQTLARRTRLDPSTVRRIVRKLEADGHIRVSRSTGRHQTNVYTLLFSCGQHGDEPVDNPCGREADCPGGTLHPEQTAPSGEARRSGKGGTAAPPRTSGTVLGGGGNTEKADAATVHTSIAHTVLKGLGRAWPLTPNEQDRLAPAVNDAIVAGWPVPALTAHLRANPYGVHSPYAVLARRLANLPPAPKAPSARDKPPWCGRCDEHTRHEEINDGALRRCPRCHPAASHLKGA